MEVYRFTFGNPAVGDVCSILFFGDARQDTSFSEYLGAAGSGLLTPEEMVEASQKTADQFAEDKGLSFHKKVGITFSFVEPRYANDLIRWAKLVAEQFCGHGWNTKAGVKDVVYDPDDEEQRTFGQEWMAGGEGSIEAEMFKKLGALGFYVLLEKRRDQPAFTDEEREQIKTKVQTIAAQVFS